MEKFGDGRAKFPIQPGFSDERLHIRESADPTLSAAGMPTNSAAQRCQSKTA